MPFAIELGSSNVRSSRAPFVGRVTMRLALVALFGAMLSLAIASETGPASAGAGPQGVVAARTSGTVNLLGGLGHEMSFAPLNDDFVNAIDLGSGLAATGSGTTIAATTETGEPYHFRVDAGAAAEGTVTLNVVLDACGSTSHSVSNVMGLDAAIACYNAQSPAGDHTITLTGNIDVPGRATTPITQPSTSVGLTVEGAGFSVTGSGTGTAASMFSVLGGGSAAFQNVTISGGGAAGIGFGGSAGVGAITNSTIDSSTTSGVEVFGGDITITDTTLDGNHTGVSVHGGSIDIDGSTITNNTPGDGIYVLGASTVSVTGSTISMNAGQGIDNFGFASGIPVSLQTVTVSDSTIANNSRSGIHNFLAVVDISNSTITGNTATGASAGGIQNTFLGEVRVTSSTISNNAGINGGGIGNSDGAFTEVIGSTISDNDASYGGGIDNTDGSRGPGRVYIGDSTISGNTATGPDTVFVGNAAGVNNHCDNCAAPPEVVIVNSTISNNFYTSDRGGISNRSGTLTLLYSTVVANTANLYTSYGGVTNVAASIVWGTQTGSSGGPIDGAGGSTYVSGGFNIVESNHPAFSAPGDLANFFAPGIGPLADNGGPTLTHLPLFGAPAEGQVTGVPNLFGEPAPTTDQRGVTRPQGDFNDTGSVESDNPCVTTSPASVSDEVELRTAILCFNGTTAPSSFLINVVADVTLTSPLPGAGSPISDLTIDGMGHTIDADGTGRVLSLGGDVELVDLDLTGGSHAQGGGVLHGGGSLTVSGSTISGNNASLGGGIYSDGIVVLVNSTISNNTASVSGGGLFNNSGTVTVLHSTITENSAPDGAGVWSSDRAVASTQVAASIIAGNTGGGGDVDLGAWWTGTNSFVSGGFNVIGTGNAGGLLNFAQPGDVTGQTAAVGPLADNGGPTETHLLLDGATAIDHLTGAPNLFGEPDPTVDQRGVARPHPVGGFKDAGSVERASGLSVVSPGCGVYDSLIEGDPILPGSGLPTLVQITGECGVPVGASAVVVTVTSKQPSGVGNLRVSAAGAAPTGGVVNYINNGLDQSNTITVPLSAAGALDVAANEGDSHVRVVVVGFYSDAGILLYTGLTPCAVADSRSGVGSFAGPFSAGPAMPDVDVTGTFNLVGDDQGGGQTDCGVPDGVVGVVVNIVSIDGTGTGGVAAGTGGTSPTETTVNYAPIGLNNAAVAYLPVDGSGMIAVDVVGTGTTHIRIVVLGYLSTTGDRYAPVNPCTAFDSRDSLAVDPDNVPTGLFAGKRIAAAATTYNVTGTIPAAQGGASDCAVPEGATAVLINLVAIQPDAVGNFRAYATGTAPTGGVLNFINVVPPVNNANTVVVPLSAAGDLDLFINAPSNDTNPTVHGRGVILGYFT